MSRVIDIYGLATLLPSARRIDYRVRNEIVQSTSHQTYHASGGPRGNYQRRFARFRWLRRVWHN
ncbi:hypothetical protein BST10_19435 [Mycolicibacter algericus DSM 45454]|uniref:Uncharacterized protein n=2 Tax=Mycolicibacter algericus TaxID=1288388 RepID=A0A7I9YAJ0_MYCAL|nr:hypothetical protein BST10_19435 [Mycolicibacter algericus DSM 45454]GFG85718.1 hypothetical protein MALGJ_23940 [Mycolicibacter algericus]